LADAVVGVRYIS